MAFWLGFGTQECACQSVNVGITLTISTHRDSCLKNTILLYVVQIKRAMTPQASKGSAGEEVQEVPGAGGAVAGKSRQSFRYLRRC